jgi:hypothetical protein
MLKKARRLTVLVVFALMAVLMIFPLEASAGRWPKAEREYATMYVPRNLRSPMTLEALDVSVTVYPGCMPRGGRIIMHVTRDRNGEVVADFLPEQEFSRPVLIDFGEAPVVIWESSHGDVYIRTSDVDGDGDGGEFYSDHFSRYSGFF